MVGSQVEASESPLCPCTRYLDGRETTVATKHLAPKGHEGSPQAHEGPPQTHKETAL